MGEKTSEIFKEYHTKAKKILEEYNRKIDAIHKKNEHDDHIVKDASVREEQILRAELNAALRKLADEMKNCQSKTA